MYVRARGDEYSKQKHKKTLNIHQEIRNIRKNIESKHYMHSLSTAPIKFICICIFVWVY